MGLLVGMGKITAVASLILSCGPCYVSPARNQSTGIFSIPPFEHLFNKIAEMLKGNSPSKAKETIQKFVDQSLGHQRTPEILMTPNVSQGQESQTRGPAESTAISDGLQRLKQKAREDLKNPSPRMYFVNRNGSFSQPSNLSATIKSHLIVIVCISILLFIFYCHATCYCTYLLK